MDVPTFGRQDGRRFDPRLSQAETRIDFWFLGDFTNDKMEICKTKKKAEWRYLMIIWDWNMVI
jgi:hypothetical protein